MPERDGKNQGEDSLKQASSCWFARHSLTSHNLRELVSSRRLVCRCHIVFLMCYVCYVYFAFVCMISLKPWPFVQAFFDMHASRQLHMFILFSCFLYVVFPEFLCHYRFIFEWRGRREFPLLDGVFFILRLRAGFLTSTYVRIQSIYIYIHRISATSLMTKSTVI